MLHPRIRSVFDRPDLPLRIYMAFLCCLGIALYFLLPRLPEWFRQNWMMPALFVLMVPVGIGCAWARRREADARPHDAEAQRELHRYRLAPWGGVLALAYIGGTNAVRAFAPELWRSSWFMVGSAVVIGGAMLWLLWVQARGIPGIGQCPRCCYDRKGLSNDTLCPECGSPAIYRGGGKSTDGWWERWAAPSWPSRPRRPGR